MSVPAPATDNGLVALLSFGGAGLMNPRPGTYSTHSRAQTGIQNWPLRF